jgi:hypothetical protein
MAEMPVGDARDTNTTGQYRVTERQRMGQIGGESVTSDLLGS